MSYSPVEDLIEESVMTVLKTGSSPTKKKNIIFKLYHLQSVFDTSFTALRLKQELIDLGYLKKYSLKNLIEDNILNKDDIILENGWLISKKNNIHCYYEKNEDKDKDISLYVEYGSAIWSLLNKTNINEIKNLGFIDITYEFLKLTENQASSNLITNWKFFLIESLLETDLSLPKNYNFLKFIKHKKVQFIQKIFFMNKKNISLQDLFFDRHSNQSIDDNLSSEGELNLNYCLKFLLSSDKQALQIEKKYRNKIKNNKKTCNLRLIPQIIEGNSPFKLCYKNENVEKKEFSWMFESDHKILKENRFFLLLNIADYAPALNCRIGIASPSIAKLQKREITPKPSSIHFLIHLFEALPKEYKNNIKDYKQYNARKLKKSASIKTLTDAVLNTLDDLKQTESFLSFFDMDILKRINKDYSFKKALKINHNFQHNPSGIFEISTPHQALEMELMFSKCQLLSLYGCIKWLNGFKPEKILKELREAVDKRIKTFKHSHEMQEILRESISKLQEGAFMPELQSGIMRSKWD